MRPEYAQDIEAHQAKIDLGAAGILARSPLDIPLLFRIDRPVGRAVIISGARFHFDKNQALPLPGDQIDLARSRRPRPKIARNNREPLPPQKPVRQVLAAPSSSQIGIGAAPARSVAETVSQALEEGEHVREGSSFRWAEISSNIMACGLSVGGARLSLARYFPKTRGVGIHDIANDSHLPGPTVARRFPGDFLYPL